MIRNFDAELTDLRGEPLRHEGKGTPMSQAVAEALIAPLGDEDATGDAKAARYELALRVVKGGDVDLTVDELALIKERVGRGCVPLAVGQIYRVLNG